MNDNRPSLVAGVAGQTALGLMVWVGLLIAKALGAFPGVSWITIIFGMLWIPAVLTLLLFAILSAKSIVRKLHRIADGLHTAHVLKSSMHGMTLNTLGPVYGVERQPGEFNRHYEQRILYAAATRDDLRMYRKPDAPRPATGEKLDAIAEENGLKRNKGESDKHLQDRVRAAITKNLNEQLEGGKA